MKVSWNWLADYVDLDGLTPQQVADGLTNAGLEVEGDLDVTGPQFERVILAAVVQLGPHPNADKLRLVTVDCGPMGHTQVVCGAPNVAVGQRIAFALDGARVYSKKSNEWFTLGPATIRGVESRGMICALEELGLEGQFTSEPGIWPLTDRTTPEQVGLPLKTLLGLASDVVLHTAPTANRGDWMSYVGIAREVSALFNRPLKVPHGVTLPLANEGQPPLTVALGDPSLCSFYAGAYLKHLKLGPSPDWVRQRLDSAGIRSINNVVDVTNYVLLELGQPLHAFDGAKLGPAGVIGVRRAHEEESLATLDDTDRTLSPEAVLITHNGHAVAMAGVMGGSATAIDDHSTSVFLEAACFPTATTRRSARSQGIRTESSARFERGVDGGTTWAALERAVRLLQDWTGAQLCWTVSGGSAAAPELSVALRLSRLEALIGREYPPEKVVAVLQTLGFTLVSQSGDTLTFNVPSFRQRDVQTEIDLIEEVVRIDGYDQVPATLPRQSAMAVTSPRQQALSRVRHTLMGLGLQEVMTPSLVGPALLDRAGLTQVAAQEIRLNNSANQEEHDRLRQGLLANLLEVARYNVAQAEPTVWAFELGRTYWLRGKAGTKQTGVQEKLCLGGVWMGQPSLSPWQPTRPTDFFTAKGTVEALFTRLGLIDDLRFEAAKAEAIPACMHPGRTATVTFKGKALGVLGQVHPTIQKQLKLKQPVFLMELDADSLLKFWHQKPGKTDASKSAAAGQVVSIGAFPAIDRDMALCVPPGVSHGDIVAALKAKADETVREIRLFDEYKGQGLPEGHRSLAYRVVLRSDTQTLTDGAADATINGLRQAVVATIPGVSLR
jgi:phenylalanyl-tRNA synthetase beta chain